MKLPKQIFKFIPLFILLSLLSFQSCKKEESAYPETIVGKWCIDKDEEQVVEFFEDGTMDGENQNQVFYSRKGSFTIEGNKLKTMYNNHTIEYMKKNKIKISTVMVDYYQGENRRYTFEHTLHRAK